MFKTKMLLHEKQKMGSIWHAFNIIIMFLLVINMFFWGMFFNAKETKAVEQLCEVPVDVVLIIDTSVSMLGSTGDGIEKIAAAKNAANNFLDLLQTNDQSALVSFASSAYLEKTLSNNHLETQTVVNTLEASGMTNIGDAIDLSNIELESSRSNPQAVKVAILLTDGQANKPDSVPHPVQYAIDKAGVAASLGYKIFTIGLGTSPDGIMLNEIANITGASYYHAPSSSDLNDIYTQISMEVCDYGSISGYKYIDENNDGNIDDQISGGAGWAIVLEQDGLADISQETDINGKYLFSGLLPGTYTVLEAGKLGTTYIQTYPVDPTYNINLTEGQNIIDINFGNYLPGNDPITYTWQTDDWGDCNVSCGGGTQSRLVYCLSSDLNEGNSGVVSDDNCDPETKPTISQSCNLQACEGSISGYKFIDENNDGDISAEISGGAGWTIVLEQEGLADISQETDISGQFLFSGLEVGEYIVKEAGKVGTNYIQTYPALPNNFYTISLGEGQNVYGRNFGNYLYTYSWQSDDWGDCSFSCGGGTQSRLVYCLSSDLNEGNSGVVSDDNCDPETKPTISQSCNLQACEGSISGYKYIDENKDGNIDDQISGGAGWTIVLEQEGLADISQETDINGKFIFSDLEPGEYIVKEAGKVGTNYIQTYPALPSPFYSLSLSLQENIIDINFGNYLYTYSWQTDDWGDCSVSCGGGTQSRLVYCLSTDLEEGDSGVVDDLNCDFETKPTTSQSCNTQSCGGSGGGGGGFIAFNLSNTQLTMQCSASGLVDITLTWLSNYSANSRVIYATSSPSVLGSAPNYAYLKSSPLYTDLVTGHSVDIEALQPETVYYFRPVSVYNNNEVIGEEKVMTQTLACNPSSSEIIVLGEESAPILEITNQVLSPFANPGTKEVEYEITVTNNGDLISFDTVLNNSLPAGLSYSDDASQNKAWNLGDISLGETKTITTKVDVAMDAKSQNYISLASTNSANHDYVSAEANLEVRSITVLAETGIALWQLILLLTLISGAVGLRYYLNQRLILSKNSNIHE